MALDFELNAEPRADLGKEARLFHSCVGGLRSSGHREGKAEHGPGMERDGGGLLQAASLVSPTHAR